MNDEPRLLQGVRRLVELICVVALFAIMLYTVGTVVSRTIVGSPLPAVIELITRWWMVPLVFGGWILAHIADEHIRVDFVIERTTGPFALLYQLGNRTLLLLFLGVIAYGGWIGATENHLRGEYGIDTGAPVWITRYAIPIMAALFAGYVIYELIKSVMQTFRSRRNLHDGTIQAATSTSVAPTTQEAEPRAGSKHSVLDSRRDTAHDDA